MSTFAGTTTFEVLTCIKCGSSYAAPEQFFDRQREQGGFHHCVQCGHRQGWSKERSKLAQAQREAEQARRRMVIHQEEAARQRRAKESAQRRLSATRGVVTRIKNRVGKGICPCCNRSFQNLRRHMANQHPEWTDAS